MCRGLERDGGGPLEAMHIGPEVIASDVRQLAPRQGIPSAHSCAESLRVRSICDNAGIRRRLAGRAEQEPARNPGRPHKPADLRSPRIAPDQRSGGVVWAQARISDALHSNHGVRNAPVHDKVVVDRLVASVQLGGEKKTPSTTLSHFSLGQHLKRHVPISSRDPRAVHAAKG